MSPESTHRQRHKDSDSPVTCSCQLNLNHGLATPYSRFFPPSALQNLQNTFFIVNVDAGRGAGCGVVCFWAVGLPDRVYTWIRIARVDAVGSGIGHGDCILVYCTRVLDRRFVWWSGGCSGVGEMMSVVGWHAMLHCWCVGLVRNWDGGCYGSCLGSQICLSA